MIRIKTFLLLLFTAVYFTSGAQVLNSTEPKENDPLLLRATEEYKQLHFVSAIELFKQFKKKYPYYEPATEMMADSYRQIKDYKNTVYWYEQLCSSDKPKPEWALRYAEALANNEEYEKSEQWYRKYLALTPTDKRAQAFAKMNIQHMTKKSDDVKVSFTNINTPESEYSPIYYKKGLLFSSNRKNSNGSVFKWDNSAFTDLWVIDRLENIRTDSATIAGTPIVAHKVPGKINTRYHEGSAVLLPEGSLMFTRNNFNAGRARTSTTGINKLKLFTAKGKNWDQIEEFPFNNNEYSVGHPAISTKGDVLIFASDKPGGYGGTDLYYSVRLGPEKLWSKPVNLGPKINTEGNEMFPYWDKDNKLYFSSTGHPGLGGLDIFEVQLKDLKPQYPPKNLGAPINSAADDFGIIIEADNKKGFFSSNRAGNDDIYAFEKNDRNLRMEGLVIDARTKLPIFESTVLIQPNDGAPQVLKTDAKGKFNLSLERETDYDIMAQKTLYLSNNKSLSTVGLKADSAITVIIELDKPQLDQQWVIKNCDSLKKVYAVEKIYYDLDKYNIRPDAQPALERLYTLMKNHPEIMINTASHTDTRASVDYNTRLSLRRGQSVKNYLVAKGIPAARILIQYYGKSRLVNNCNEEPCSEEMQQLNRRTEFEIILNGINLSQLECE